MIPERKPLRLVVTSLMASEFLTLTTYSSMGWLSLKSRVMVLGRRIMRSSRLMDSLIHWASCEVPRSVPEPLLL